ncbi:DUF2075 domain-containing protein [Mariniphaga sediminis]|uniref:DUF2075 domain-containing protein n=1 Tax=Mariniphaga sediminis TaxID=1628158 RepID=A0A399CV50_9BACT|nr:DUF2075 domain-containing protein [Mariniphaga sediminis]RIH63327.1 DUF2075 domain-containing protein [Mariniphaga sediminis]
MKRAFYNNTIKSFNESSYSEILGTLVDNNEYSTEQTQKNAWKYQIIFLQQILSELNGSIYFEYAIPRIGKRIDVLLIIESIIFIIEFKVGEKEYHSHAIDQVWDYALDLKNFHETSHDKIIIPILIATDAKSSDILLSIFQNDDNLFNPIRSNSQTLPSILSTALRFLDGHSQINTSEWEKGRYQPTPTIIEAAMALYNQHSVADISRSDASAINLSQTSDELSTIIKKSRDKSEKAICFVTGVPGAGKTLVGLNIATKHFDKESELYSVFLSGNGPLVKILQEALARDKVKRAKERGEKLTKKEAKSQVQAFIQNVHHFRDEGIRDKGAPIEHVVLFDEAQRAWTFEQTTNFMRQKKGIHDFNMSEPEFLVSCLDRHPDWAVVVCLVGGGQEINTGEAGISEWLLGLERKFPDWKIYISNRLTDSEYNAEEILHKIRYRNHVIHSEYLHLAVSMRSFRAENVSLLVKQILDLNIDDAKSTLLELKSKYPIVVTRDFSKAKEWLKNKARGTERYGIVVSSQAQRLKPYAIDVKSPIDPIHWFLDGKDDIRSSYYLEDVATEFHIQGLELDWACVAWDGDFRFSPEGWVYKSFKGKKWQNINKTERKLYLKNAYRVLLTRARQGMVIVIPTGDKKDPTRLPEFYNDTFNYLKAIGFEAL